MIYPPFQDKIIKNPQQYRITVESTNKESTDLSRFRLLTIFILAMGLISQVHYFLDKDGSYFFLVLMIHSYYPIFT